LRQEIHGKLNKVGESMTLLDHMLITHKKRYFVFSQRIYVRFEKFKQFWIQEVERKRIKLTKSNKKQNNHKKQKNKSRSKTEHNNSARQSTGECGSQQGNEVRLG
jgi:deoxyribodipyrimidine photolyase